MKSPSWLTSPPRDLRSENHRVSSRCCLSEEPQHARGRTGRYLIFSASNSLCGGLLNFFLLANQSFCNTHTHTVTHQSSDSSGEKTFEFDLPGSSWPLCGPGLSEGSSSGRWCSGSAPRSPPGEQRRDVYAHGAAYVPPLSSLNFSFCFSGSGEEVLVSHVTVSSCLPASATHGSEFTQRSFYG